MGRSGYSDEFDGPELILWRGAVDRALNGRRGQKFLRDLIEALDRLPEKRLIAEELQADGAVCALGSVGLLRGVDMSTLDPEDHRKLGEIFGIAPSMVQEIEFVNDDDDGGWLSKPASPEARFQRVRQWAESQLTKEE